jgi:DNA-directed RNA polymerase subunit RPC12/RpoP
MSSAKLPCGKLQALSVILIHVRPRGSRRQPSGKPCGAPLAIVLSHGRNYGSSPHKQRKERGGAGWVTPRPTRPGNEVTVFPSWLSSGTSRQYSLPFRNKNMVLYGDVQTPALCRVKILASRSTPKPGAHMTNQGDSMDSIFLEFLCPNCGQKLTAKVGLSPDTSHNDVECPVCHQRIVALVPGPVLGGPFSAEA